MKHVFIVGCKGIPAKYGGFETFVEKLTEYRQSEEIQYHVACMKSDDVTEEVYTHNNAECFQVAVPSIGPAKAVYYDVKALQWVIRSIQKNNLQGSIVYILACRIGPFMGYFKKQLRKLGCTLFINPDGHEWKRAKWNTMIKKYWKYSEGLMVKHADLLVCDSVNIEKYIKEEYKDFQPNTTFIAYGAKEADAVTQETKEKLAKWYEEKNLEEKGYYLIVGRFVPENNYETVIREFMKSTTQKKLALISNVEQNKFYEVLKANTGFDADDRIAFVGTVYDAELLQAIRQNAYGYIHGHEVGGTNPSLLEALATTDLNLLLDVSFNREVGEDTAVYWKKSDGALEEKLNELEHLSEEDRTSYGNKAKKRIKEFYSWEEIVEKYENIFRKN